MSAIVLALALAQDGSKEWTRCANCHTTPDASYGADRKFLKLVEKTAWVGAPGNRELLAKRTAIIEYLKSLESPKPGAAKEAGRVGVNFETGYVVLVPDGKANGDGIRLAYTKADRTREIAAGKYAVRRYVVEDGDWAVWATGAGRAVTVKAGETTKLELDLDIHLKMNLMKHGAKTQIGGSFSGDSGMGLSLLQGDARVVVTWAVADDSGECAYGWGGGFGGAWQAPKEFDFASAKAKLVFENGPFTVRGEREKALKK